MYVICIIPNAKITIKVNIRDFNKCDVGFVITSFENTLFFMMSVFLHYFVILYFNITFFGIF